MGALALLLAACDGGGEATEADGSGESEEAAGDQTGGTLNIALNAQPPTFDPVTTTSTATRDTARMVFESLLVLNAEYEPTPFLAEEVENENNQIFTFHLRSEEHTSELQSRGHLVCRLLLEKKKKINKK